jgi:hypothetical protein
MKSNGAATLWVPILLKHELLSQLNHCPVITYYTQKTFFREQFYIPYVCQILGTYNKISDICL